MSSLRGGVKDLKGLKNVIYMSLAVGMLIYALPKLNLGEGFTLPTLFGVVWVCFALFVVAAHLHELLGVDEERRQQMNRVQRMKKWQTEQTLQGRRKILQLRK
ncbi:hypothetical protein ABND78_16110 [Paenibacillus larvae]|uniref:hypothetical protein n=1 Tax=Paenibacillus larvae TaxID=1464 RepID=UPI002892F121|nr:hypothetical protein [Paenibacillus larvae]